MGELRQEAIELLPVTNKLNQLSSPVYNKYITSLTEAETIFFQRQK
jgi:hypothetical protein